MRAIALLGPNADADDVAPFATAARIPIPIHAAFDRHSSADVALIFGGDGTIHRHLQWLVDTQTPALIIPTGSGNDFARALGVRTRAHSLAAWRTFCKSRTHTRAIDVGEITPTDSRQLATGSLFCCVSGAGIDSDINRRANELPRWMRANGGYALSVVRSAISFRRAPITVDFEDEHGSSGQISEPALMCAFANARAYGHGMRIAPHAQLDDGLLDLIFVRRAGPARLLTVFPRVYFGAHLQLPEIEHRRVRRLHISSDPPLDIYADGEFICRTPAEVSVRPKAFKVIG